MCITVSEKGRASSAPLWRLKPVCFLCCVSAPGVAPPGRLGPVTGNNSSKCGHLHPPPSRRYRAAVTCFILLSYFWHSIFKSLFGFHFVIMQKPDAFPKSNPSNTVPPTGVPSLPSRASLVLGDHLCSSLSAFTNDRQTGTHVPPPEGTLSSICGYTWSQQPCPLPAAPEGLCHQAAILTADSMFSPMIFGMHS